jgi:hypothetical protein
MKCPRCAYERRPSDQAPAWQCPSCKIAYVKAAKVAAPVAPAAPAAPVAAERPPSKIVSPARQDEREEHEARIRESLAARGQKIVIYCVLLNLVLRGADRGHVFPDLVMLCLYLLTAAWSLLGIVKICSALQRPQGQKILFMVLSFFPLINLVALVYLSMKATRLLREAGWSVGLLGARP